MPVCLDGRTPVLKALLPSLSVWWQHCSCTKTNHAAQRTEKPRWQHQLVTLRCGDLAGNLGNRSIDLCEISINIVLRSWNALLALGTVQVVENRVVISAPIAWLFLRLSDILFANYIIPFMILFLQWYNFFNQNITHPHIVTQMTINVFPHRQLDTESLCSWGPTNYRVWSETSSMSVVWCKTWFRVIPCLQKLNIISYIMRPQLYHLDIRAISCLSVYLHYHP